MGIEVIVENTIMRRYNDIKNKVKEVPCIRLMIFEF